MTAPASSRTGRSLPWSLKLLSGYTFLILLLFAYTDFSMPRMIEDSDYTTTFYASARLILMGRANQIYPAKDSTTLAGSAYDRAAHELLPNFSRQKTAIYPYLPLVSVLLAPISLLSPPLALFAFQLLSLAALVASSLLLDSTGSESSTDIGSTLGRKFSIFWWSLLYLPIAHCLFIGQSTLLLGLLPLSAGFYFLRKGRPISAGLSLAICFLKPQMLIAALFVSVCMLVRGQFKTLFSMLGAILLICTAVLCFFNHDLLSLWLHSLQVVENVYASASNGVVTQIVASWPRALLLITPLETHALVRPLAYAMGFTMAALALWLLVRMGPRDNESFVNLTMLCALSLTPLIAPHFFYYDLSIMLIALSILFDRSTLQRQPALRWLGMQLFIWIDIYVLLIFIVKPLATPVLLLVIFFEMYRRVLLAVRAQAKSSHPKTDGGADASSS